MVIRISLKFVPECPIDNKWALVQVMADAYMRYEGEMSLIHYIEID